MSPTIIKLSSEEIHARREALLLETSASIETLRAKRESGLLDSAEDRALRELEDLEFLDGRTA